MADSPAGPQSMFARPRPTTSAPAALALLGQKARALSEREWAAGWVFETARRLVLEARTAAARRARHEAAPHQACACARPARRA